MSCKQFRTAISDAAVGGQPLQSAGLLQGRPPQKAAATTDDSVQQHLDACESCRAFYAAEQELFAAMDVGLSRVANSEPSVTFLPRVRAAIAAQSRPEHEPAHVPARAGVLPRGGSLTGVDP